MAMLRGSCAALLLAALAVHCALALAAGTDAAQAPGNTVSAVKCDKRKGCTTAINLNTRVVIQGSAAPAWLGTVRAPPQA
jgi:hypothetical protein